MGNERVYNFSAGPSMLPLEVLERAGAEITNYQGSGMSVMEMSHRSKVFVKIFEDTKAKLRRLMNVPEEYEILFLQGGASTQFSMAPLNLIGKTGKADYAVTGNFSIHPHAAQRVCLRRSGSDPAHRLSGRDAAARPDEGPSARIRAADHQQHEGQHRPLPGRRHHRRISGRRQGARLSDHLRQPGL